MHIPDGLIPLWQCVIYFVVALPFYLRSIKWIKQELRPEDIPLLATLTAGVFAAQSLNIPILWGTSGHMIGAALVSILFNSPYAGITAILVVLLIQAFVFLDGGILALGANLLNMGIIASFTSFYAWRYLRRFVSETVSVFVSSWISVVLAAVVCAVELNMAGVVPLWKAVYFMGLYHLLIGLFAEGLITVIVYKSIRMYLPDYIALPGGIADGE